MLNNSLYTKQLIIKPTSACNFDCTFCSAKLMNIPMHDKVPSVLKEYLIENKPNSLIITGGEPLINPKSYFEDLLQIMDSLNIEYEISLTSNLILWYNNPEKYDWLFNNPRIFADTSFQYGNDRRDSSVYTEDRFLAVYKTFIERYNKPLLFIYVVNSENEKYVKKACELANSLHASVKFNSQIPVGKATEYYPRYKILDLYLMLIKEGLIEANKDLLESFRKHTCPFTASYKFCLGNRVVYVDQNEKLVVGNCEEQLSSAGKLEIEKGALFKECLLCPMFTMCNSCSINRKCTEAIKEEHCKWMKAHYTELKHYSLI